MDNNGQWVTIGAVVLLVVVIVYLVWPKGPKVTENYAYFYDLTDNKVVELKGNEVPPVIDPDTGNELVGVHFYTCGFCVESNGERFVGYYEKYTEEAKAEKLEQLRKLAAGEKVVDNTTPDQRKGQLISLDGKKWVELYSSAGQKIRFRPKMMSCPTKDDSFGAPQNCTHMQTVLEEEDTGG
ncbi:MAG: hypothetical protein CMJ49_01325 [Planctomycetaceae bacterium]|nr:hypothetical protein [Planctomycetaceae bacterium]